MVDYLGYALVLLSLLVIKIRETIGAKRSYALTQGCGNNFTTADKNLFEFRQIKPKLKHQSSSLLATVVLLWRLLGLNRRENTAPIGATFCAEMMVLDSDSDLGVQI